MEGIPPRPSHVGDFSKPHASGPRGGSFLWKRQKSSPRQVRTVPQVLGREAAGESASEMPGRLICEQQSDYRGTQVSLHPRKPGHPHAN